MLLTEITKAPISIDSVAHDAVELADRWLGTNYDPKNLNREIASKFPKFIKQYNRNIGDDAEFIDKYQEHISNKVADIISNFKK